MPSARRLPSAVCSGCAVPRASGKTLVRRTVTTAPNIADPVQMITIHNTERPAIRPPAAASLLFAMPTMSKATTRGITVILSALSHKVPTKLAIFSNGSWMLGSRPFAAAPRRCRRRVRQAPNMRASSRRRHVRSLPRMKT